MTIKDIARLCGVSVSTVSRVLNERPDVSPPVREAVLRAIRQSNYIPNNSARDLVKASSDAIGLVVRGVANPFFADVIKVIGRRIDASGYTMVMQQLGIDEDEVKRGAIMEREKKLRGVIFLGGRSDYSSGETALLNVPFVCCTYTNSFGDLTPDSYSSVSIDDQETARGAVEQLCRLGHRRIAALVSTKNDRSISELRYLGYLRGLEANGITPDPRLTECAGSYEMGAAYAAMTRLIDRDPGFTAVFCISDAMAVAAMKALDDHGRRVPRDCSVIGIDGIPFSEYVTPTLTTLCQPSEKMGAESVDILVALIEGRGAVRHTLLSTALRPGASVRPL